MQLPNFGPHNKQIWAGLLIGAVALGLYLRHRSSTGQTTATDSASTGNDLPNMPNVDGSMDPYSGTSDVTATGSIPGPAGPTGPAGPRGPKGHNGHTRNHHHGNNNGGKGGTGGSTRHHHHKRTGGSAKQKPVLVHGTVEHHPSVHNTPHHKKKASR